MLADTRLHPWLALRCLVAVSRDPERTDAGSAMVRALEGRSRERLMQRIAVHPTGSRVVAEHRRLESTLADLDSLATLPAGSFGACYAEWARTEGISIQGLLQASDLYEIDIDEDRRLLELRQACAHDLWHQVTGYGRDLLGELALLHFSWVQTRNTGFLLPCWLGLLGPCGGPAGRRLVFGARRRARRAAWLPGADWEALLARPMAEVRERLGLGAPPSYTPVWRTEAGAGGP